MVLEEIKRQPLSPSQLEELLNNLPLTIIELYNLILGRAGTRGGDSLGSSGAGTVNNFARHVLFWIAYQLHGMNEEEMMTGVSLVEAAGLLPQREPPRSITEADVRVMPHATNLQRDISRGCGALVAFTEDNTFVAAHPSVQQFLVTPTETLKRSYPELKHHQKYYCGGLRPDDIIRQLCTNYLLLRYFSDPRYDEPCATWAAKVKKRMWEHPFGRYSARSWLKHANMSGHQIDLSGNPEFTEGSDQQRLLYPAAGASSDRRCSRSWMEIWWYYEKPGLDFPTDGVPLDTLSSGASLPPRLQWLGTPDDSGKPATPSLPSRTWPAPRPRPRGRAPALSSPLSSALPPSRRRVEAGRSVCCKSELNAPSHLSDIVGGLYVQRKRRNPKCSSNYSQPLNPPLSPRSPS